ncbi:hypothetical protein E2C01_003584 [Portunus trituberculatus]|uniref:Uncharacterized protein n=1 Tax=Portunus trituberculatus TaxID=210409 RepID=A0A5B7CN58_PORTR|nr:hypothetical protein [Portunus trituberculatus]
MRSSTWGHFWFPPQKGTLRLSLESPFLSFEF